MASRSALPTFDAFSLLTRLFGPFLAQNAQAQRATALKLIATRLEASAAIDATFEHNGVIADHAVDFCCHDLRLAIDVAERGASAARRTQAVEAAGYRLIRVSPRRATAHTERVMRDIAGEVVEARRRVDHIFDAGYRIAL